MLKTYAHAVARAQEHAAVVANEICAFPAVSRCSETSILLEPANGFEPLTCALRVRFLRIYRNPRSLGSLKSLVILRSLRQRGNLKKHDGGECAPRVPQKKDRVRIADGQARRVLVVLVA